MGSSKDRRKLKRLLLRQGLTPPQRPPRLPPKPVRISVWKQIPKWTWALVMVFSVLITITESYPWLSLQEEGILDPVNPYTELFTVSNGGYVPITDLDVTCKPNFKSPSVSVFRNDFIFHDFAAYLSHDSRATIPCFHIYAGHVPEEATLEVVISYAMFHLNWKTLRKHQTFHFRSVSAKNGHRYWIFTSRGRSDKNEHDLK